MTESGVRFRCYPTASQVPVARTWIGHQRFIKNAKVLERDYFRRFEHAHPALWGLCPDDDQAYAHFITEQSAFLREVPSQILRNGAYRFMNALARWRKGLGGAPKVQSRYGRQSVLITRELFRFVETADSTPDQRQYRLLLGTPKFPFGQLRFQAHRPYKLPNMLVLSVEAGKWFVSFCFDNPPTDDAGQPVVLRDEDELAYELQGHPDLASVIWAGDLGVTIPCMGSDERRFAFSAIHRQRLDKAEINKRRYQRRMARLAKTSGKRRKWAGRAARQSQYQANVRRELAHQMSYRLVSDERYQVFGFEDLNIKNMTARPAPRRDSAGRYTANGAAAKAGLNAAILESAWGLMRRFTAYTAKRRNKLCLLLPPQYSSQECAPCGHVDAANRPDQATFRCTRCGHRDHADANASAVLKKRAEQVIRSGAIGKPEKKTVCFRKKKHLDAECIEVTSGAGACKPADAPVAQAAMFRRPNRGRPPRNERQPDAPTTRDVASWIRKEMFAT